MEFKVYPQYDMAWSIMEGVCFALHKNCQEEHTL